MLIQHYLKQSQNRVNKALQMALPAAQQTPQKLHRAMRYAVLSKSKRLRSALIYAVGDSLGANSSVLDHCAVAIELIHAFSLIHDDLPALDNDNLRHGKPSCHVAFGEATAILAGDALLTLAFEVLAKINNKQLDANNILKMIQIVSMLSGSRGMAGGEAMDVDLEVNDINLNTLMTIYKLKTSCLICASILLGALASNCTDTHILSSLEKFGSYLGLAFQIHDDIIGIESSSKVLGKPKDTHKKTAKLTYPLIVGLDKAKTKEKYYLNQCYKFYMQVGLDQSMVWAISEYIIKRKY